jgi:hypothetical protein
MAIKRFVTTLDEELIIQLKIRAATENIPVNKILEKLINEYLDKHKKN